MALIKHARAQEIARDAIVLDLGDLHRQGEALAAKARDQAQAIIAEAHAERERLIAGASERGFAEGHAKGHAEGFEKGREAGRAEAYEFHKKQFDDVAHVWLRVFEQFEHERTALLADARRDVLTLAVEMAERITRRTVDHDPKQVAVQLETALRMVVQPTRLTVAAHPDDLQLAEDVLPGLLQRLGLSDEADVVADMELSRGSCRVRTERGVIDATIDAQLERLTRALLPERIERRAFDVRFDAEETNEHEYAPESAEEDQAHESNRASDEQDAEAPSRDAQNDLHQTNATRGSSVRTDDDPGAQEKAA